VTSNLEYAAPDESLIDFSEVFLQLDDFNGPPVRGYLPQKVRRERE
jgi:hypothetical protein